MVLELAVATLISIDFAAPVSTWDELGFMPPCRYKQTKVLSMTNRTICTLYKLLPFPCHSVLQW